MYAKDIVDDLLNIFGVEVAMVKLAENKHYPGCRVCRGKLKDVLTEIGLQRLQVQAGDPLRADHHKPARGRNHDRLSADAADGPAEIGIDIRKPEHQHEDHGDGEDAQQQAEDEGNLSRDCLLNYHIGVADKIVIRDSQTNGTFMVVSGVHEGTRSGNWKTTVEVKPA